MNPAQAVVRAITLADVAGYRACVGAVMRERKFLAYLEPFSLTQTAAFVADNIEKGNPHYVAEDVGRIVGWCDIQRESVPTYAHEGMLGMGLLPDYRGHGLGERLIRAALDAASGARIRAGVVIGLRQQYPRHGPVPKGGLRPRGNAGSRPQGRRRVR